MKKHTLYIIAMLFATSQIFADNLNTAEGQGSTTTIDAGTYIDVASTTLSIGSSASDVTSVMVIATFEVRMANSLTQNHEAIFRLADATNSIYSGTINRTLDGNKDGDVGIGSLVYIFDMSSYTGDITFKLQHTTDNSSYDNTTSGTIVAIALGTTSSKIQLNNDMKAISTGVAIPSNSYQPVTDLTTDAIFLPVSGEIFVAASVNNDRTSGSAQTGYWKFQMRQGLSGTWTDIGNEISRTFNNNNDYGIVSLGLMVTDLARDNYYFRLAHKGSLASPTLETSNTTLIAVAMAYEDPTLGGRSFPAFSTTVASATTTSASLTPALSQDGTPASNTDMFFYSQFNMSASAALDAPTFDMYLTNLDGAPLTYSSRDQQRRLSSDADVGSGACVGLAENLVAGTNYRASVRHQSDGAITLTTSNIILSGFQITDRASEGYWTGGNSTAWNNTANWNDASIPGASTHVVIPGDATHEPILASSGSCNSLNIMEDGELTVNTGITLTINGDLVVESGGSIIDNGTATVSITGDAIAERYVTKDVWHYISSPSTNVTLDATWATNNDVHVPAGGNYSFFEWNEPNNIWYILGGANFTIPTTFASKTGYAVTFDSDRNIEFSGDYYSATSTSTIYKTDGTGRYGINLVGNPYMAPLSLSDFTNSANNPNIIGTIWFWSETGAGSWVYPADNYSYWSGAGNVGNGLTAPSDNIAVAQSFMVRVDMTGYGSKTLYYDKSWRTHGNPNFLKDDSDISRIKLAVQFANEAYNETLISFIDDATNGFDRDYDGEKLLPEANLLIYTPMLNGSDLLAIQGLPKDFQNPVTVPLIIENNVTGSFKLFLPQLENFPADVEITLEDKDNGNVIKLNENSEYNFNLNQNDIWDDRFLVHFRSVTAVNETPGELADITLYSNDKTIHINAYNTLINTIEIINTTGKVVHSEELNKTGNMSVKTNLPSGIYFIRLNADYQTTGRKVFIR